MCTFRQTSRYGYGDELEYAIDEGDFEGAKTLARRHRELLPETLGGEALVSAWSAVEDRFIETMERRHATK